MLLAGPPQAQYASHLRLAALCSFSVIASLTRLELLCLPASDTCLRISNKWNTTGFRISSPSNSKLLKVQAQGFSSTRVRVLCRVGQHMGLPISFLSSCECLLAWACYKICLLVQAEAARSTAPRDHCSSVECSSNRSASLCASASIIARPDFCKRSSRVLCSTLVDQHKTDYACNGGSKHGFTACGPLP